MRYDTHEGGVSPLPHLKASNPIAMRSFSGNRIIPMDDPSAVSVVDGQKGTVLYTKTATVRDQAQRDAQLDGIAKEIGALRSLWE